MLSNNQRRLIEVLQQVISEGDFISMQEMADRIGVYSPNTVYYHLKKLEDKGLIVRDASGKVTRVNSPDEKLAVAFLPLLGSAACGEPLDQIVSDNTVRMLPIPLRLLGRNTSRQLYLIKAIGDSMEPKIEEGDIVIFENKHPLAGNIVVARTKDGFTIKVLRETMEQVILNPINNNYQPFVFDKSQENKEFNIDGVAVAVFKSQENLEVKS
jgi:repressor LexA